MKAKVIRYTDNGNGVVTRYMELEPYAENVYLSLAKKNEMGNDGLDSLFLVCKIDDIYFVEGQYARRMLGEESSKKTAASFCCEWVARMLRSEKDGRDVSQLPIRVFEALGYDTTPLLQAHEAYKARMEKKRQEWKEREAEKRKQAEQEHQQWLDEQKQAFLAGEKIAGETFVEITMRDGFDIHIRTKGVFIRNLRYVTKNCSMGLSWCGRHHPSTSGCDKAIRDYLKFLQVGAAVQTNS